MLLGLAQFLCNNLEDDAEESLVDPKGVPVCRNTSTYNWWVKCLIWCIVYLCKWYEDTKYVKAQKVATKFGGGAHVTWVWGRYLLVSEGK